MWFKNVQAYRLERMPQLTAAALSALVAGQAHTPLGNLDMTSTGWVSPRDNGQLAHGVGANLLLALRTDKKLLPASVIREATRVRALELEEQQGFKPGRKQLKEIKEQVTDELLPRAFVQTSVTRVWLDVANGWLVVDAAAPSKADAVFKALLKSFGTSPAHTLRTELSPVAAMSDWLAADEAPAGFTVDQDTELRSRGEGKATVRYIRHTLEPDDIRRHIAAGKQCTRLAMTWADRVSFVLTESLTLKRLAPLDVLKENGQESTANEDERYDSDFVLMAGELNKLLAELVDALGGEAKRQ